MHGFVDDVRRFYLSKDFKIYSSGRSLFDEVVVHWSWWWPCVQHAMCFCAGRSLQSSEWSWPGLATLSTNAVLQCCCSGPVLMLLFTPAELLKCRSVLRLVPWQVQNRSQYEGEGRLEDKSRTTILGAICWQSHATVIARMPVTQGVYCWLEFLI